MGSYVSFFLSYSDNDDWTQPRKTCGCGSGLPATYRAEYSGPNVSEIDDYTFSVRGGGQRVDLQAFSRTPLPPNVGTWAAYMAEHWASSVYGKGYQAIQYSACGHCVNAAAHSLMHHLPNGWPEEIISRSYTYEPLKIENAADLEYPIEIVIQ